MLSFLRHYDATYLQSLLIKCLSAVKDSSMNRISAAL